MVAVCYVASCTKRRLFAKKRGQFTVPEWHVRLLERQGVDHISYTESGVFMDIESGVSRKPKQYTCHHKQFYSLIIIVLNSPYRKSSPPKVVKGVHFKHLTHLLRLFKLFLWGRAVGLSMLQNLFADWRSQTSLWDSPHSPILKNVNSCSNGAWYGSQHRALQSKWPNANKLLLMEVVSRKPWKSRETRLLVTSHQESSLFKLGLIKSMFVFLL